MTDLKRSVLIVEDEALVADLWSMILEDMGIEVCGIAATAQKAIELAVLHRPKLVLMDMRLKGKLDGVDASLVIHERVGSRVIFITGSKEAATIARIELDHAERVLFKPVTETQIQNAVLNVMRGQGGI